MDELALFDCFQKKRFIDWSGPSSFCEQSNMVENVSAMEKNIGCMTQL